MLGEVAEQTGETCYIARFEDLKERCVAMVTPNNPSSGYVVPGRHLALHAASSAKAILAFQAPALVRSIVPYPLPRLTDKTIVDMDALLAEFDAIRQCKWPCATARMIRASAGWRSRFTCPMSA